MQARSVVKTSVTTHFQYKLATHSDFPAAVDIGMKDRIVFSSLRYFTLGVNVNNTLALFPILERHPLAAVFFGPWVPLLSFLSHSSASIANLI